MNKLDTSSWSEFEIGKYFDVKRGKRIVENVDYFNLKNDENPFNVITAKTSNNGVNGYYSKSNCPKNTLVACGEVSGMITTFQENECWVLDTCRIFTPLFKGFNKWIALFIIPIFNQNTFRYSYGKSANPDDIKKLIIKLPVDLNREPDWRYMEEYMKQLWERERDWWTCSKSRTIWYQTWYS
ncbi:MAG: restriction endonuclease subunit S [Mycoplasmataceae bacterium]|nr:restriction endonuclease subunit S [Mycoplasmataceae bacterium]